MGFKPLGGRGIAAWTQEKGNFTTGEADLNGSSIPFNQGVADARDYYVSQNGRNATQCTWWVAERAKATGIYNMTTYTSAAKWQYDSYTPGITKHFYSNESDVRQILNNISAGDILVFGKGSKTGLDGHVVFVEAKAGDTIVISEAANTGAHPWWLCVWYFNIDSWVSKRMNKGVSNALSHWFWSDEILACVLKTGGGGEGGDIGPVPDQPPVDPPPGEDPDHGHWEPVYESIETMYDTGDIYLTDRYECNPESMAGDSGDQDTPKVPKWWYNPNTRINFKWGPLNCYTEERTLTYDDDGEPHWSDWTTISAEQNEVSYIPGSYGNIWDTGYWEIDGFELSGWDDEWENEV